MLGCNSLPEELKERAKSYPKSVDRAEKFAKAQEDKFEDFMQTRPHLHEHSKSEKLPENFEAYDLFISESKNLCKVIDTIIERDKAKDSLRLEKILYKIDKNIDFVKSVSEYPYERVKMIERDYEFSNI